MDALHTPNIDMGLDLGAKTFRMKLARLIEAETSALAKAAES
jgi:hypothetical protein